MGHSDGAVAVQREYDSASIQAGMDPCHARQIPLGNEAAIGPHNHEAAIVLQPVRSQYGMFQRNSFHGFDWIDRKTGDLSASHGSVLIPFPARYQKNTIFQLRVAVRVGGQVESEVFVAVVGWLVRRHYV